MGIRSCISDMSAALTTAVDSMLLQVKFDNTLLGNSLTRAFEEVGTHRYKLDSTLVDYYHIRRSGVQPILSVLPGIEPGWKLPAEPVVLPDSLSSVTEYHASAKAVNGQTAESAGRTTQKYG